MLCAYSIGAPIGAGLISREKHYDPLPSSLLCKSKLPLAFHLVNPQFCKVNEGSSVDSCVSQRVNTFCHSKKPAPIYLHVLIAWRYEMADKTRTESGKHGIADRQLAILIRARL